MRTALRTGEFRLPMLALMWLAAGTAVYTLCGDSGAGLLPPTLQLHLAQFPIQQLSAAFPTFAQTIALAFVSVWMLGVSRDGAAVVCGVWMVLEAGFQYAQRSDVASWIIPRLPWFFRDVWPLNYATNYLGRGTFSMNNVVAAVFGGFIAFFMVANSKTGTRQG